MLVKERKISPDHQRWQTPSHISSGALREDAILCNYILSFSTSTSVTSELWIPQQNTQIPEATQWIIQQFARLLNWPPPTRKEDNIEAWSAFKNKKELYTWTTLQIQIQIKSPEDWKSGTSRVPCETGWRWAQVWEHCWSVWEELILILWGRSNIWPNWKDVSCAGRQSKALLC